MKIALFHRNQIPNEVLIGLKEQWSLDHPTKLSNRCMLLESQPITSENKERIRHFLQAHQTDIGFLPDHFASDQIKLLAMDMDSTLINIECIDEIADAVGKKKEVSEITEAAMRGEIKDFSESLRRRVALLKGTPADALESVFNEKLRLNPGAHELITGAHARGIHTLLVSGGFTYFTQRLQEILGLKETHANSLEIIDGKLTGQVLGDIVDGNAKAVFVQTRCDALGITKHAAVTMGDGSNDLIMMKDSGLSIGYRAKPIVQSTADIAFNYVGLDAWLDLL